MNDMASGGEYSEFKGWMAEFHFGADEELLKLQWASLGTLSKKLESDDLETLVRLALKSKQAPADADTQRITELFNAEPSFSAISHARELQVLSAAALVHLARAPNSKLSVNAALTLCTSLVAGARKVSLPMDLPRISAAAIAALSSGVGRRPLMPVLLKVPRISFETGAKALETNVWVEAKQGIAASGAAADAAVQQLMNQFINVSRYFEKVVRQQDEELQMLWWLLGGRSEDLDVAFESVTGEKQALVLAKELAAHTVLPPGPQSVTALLSRAGLKTKGKVEVAKAISGCDTAWLKSIADSDPISPVTLPIHFGIQRQLEVGSGTAWVANWAAVTGLKEDLSLAPLALGELFYRERLLQQAS